MTGLFVTVDGPGGIGKSTLVQAVCGQLRAAGRRVHATAEPSTSPLGRFTRANADTITGHALACLVAADRYQHLTSEILPALASGATVICDRYLPSSLVLQRLDGVPLEFIVNLNAAADLPHLAVILTADPAVVAARIASRGAHHRFERDTAVPAREVALYEQATVVLRELHVPVMAIDVGHATPTEAARQVVESLTARYAA
ncbi:dTMP kinase [Kitasatospora sp. RB6PN24]|uniref:dTMP kinase n=1 Tax=Kitasatospora humi TaxID=2893891 RepID=UPI001E47058D|nr:dTMP kinase [Kitasatospora humi]MCC9311148.1 dTMP kinase [Kitasatospora humi]